MDTAPFWSIESRDAVAVSGPDAARYLQGQVSQDLQPLAVGASGWTLLLAPTGRIEVLARVWRTGEDEFVLDTDAGFGDELEDRLARFKIRVKVELERRPWTAVVVCGAAGDAPAGAVVSWWGEPYALVGAGPTPPVEVDEAPTEDLERARVAAGWPTMGREIVVGETIPAETGLTPVAVDFRKGCYPGQELVERMDARGAAAPRTLRILDVGHGAEPGDPVLVDGEEVGRLTSVAAGRALGYVRRGVDLGALPHAQLGA